MTKINKNIVIAALARDCGESLHNNIILIEQLRERFAWSQVVIVENDSKDNTKQILANWEKDKKQVKIISQDFGTTTIPSKTEVNVSPTLSFYRIEKMSQYRNIYLDYIAGLSNQIDYVIVIDIDIKSFSVEGLVKSIINAPEDWGGIFANGCTRRKILGFTSKMYFDMFALYEYPLIDKFYYDQKYFDESFQRAYKNIKNNKYYNVVSAFGGIGIYKYEAIKDIRYKALKNSVNEEEGICEHIPNNVEVINRGYKNYIARDFDVFYGEHLLGLMVKYYLPINLFNFLYPKFKGAVGAFNKLSYKHKD